METLHRICYKSGRTERYYLRSEDHGLNLLAANVLRQGSSQTATYYHLDWRSTPVAARGPMESWVHFMCIVVQCMMVRLMGIASPHTRDSQYGSITAMPRRRRQYNGTPRHFNRCAHENIHSIIAYCCMDFFFLKRRGLEGSAAASGANLVVVPCKRERRPNQRTSNSHWTNWRCALGCLSEAGTLGFL
jgi:hypothetical protein